MSGIDHVLSAAAQTGDFAGKRVAIVPFPALGDLTIYLRLGWLFQRAGADVTFCSNALRSSQVYFPWARVLSDADTDLDSLAQEFDLVIACFEKYYHIETWSPAYADLGNVAFVTAKKISRDSGLDGQAVTVGDKSYARASRPFCLNSRSGTTMVDWVEQYAEEVFGLKMDSNEGFFAQASSSGGSTSDGLVLIFPTTPQAKKNYWLSGFKFLARLLQRRGWTVEFVCMPAERDSMEAALPGFAVNSFPDVGALIDKVATASAVISNDSGGGHLASMLGLPTFTITRRHEHFVWRPGFGNNNKVIYPWFRFKWLDKKYIWRPFVPVWRIAMHLGKRHLP